MSFPEFTGSKVPTGPGKILYMNPALALLLVAAAGLGFLMLYSVAGGSVTPWAAPQMKRFALGVAVMFAVAMVPIWFWRNVAGIAYAVSILLLVLVELVGTVGMGAQRWIDLGFMRLQPSEFTKLTMVMLLAAYYDRLDIQKTSRPLWVAVPAVLILLPTFLVLRQPDLGTSILLVLGGAMMMFLAGVHWGYFAALGAGGGGLAALAIFLRGTEWQLLKDYQYLRIDAYLNPESDPHGSGYHIIQSKIALGSGGWTGRGLMQGSQSRLNFLPEKHTDFIFTTLAEELGFIGASSLLALYSLIIFYCIVSALRTRDRFSSMLILGFSATFFLFFAVNISMVTGLMPVVGVPLPFISYGGSAMLMLMIGFGLVQSAHIHRPRNRI